MTSDIRLPTSDFRLRTADLDYDLPESAIATSPASPRDSARLLVVNRAASTIEHRHIRDLPSLLGPGDLIVRNSTRVLPARFRGVRTDTGGKVEGLYLGDALTEGSDGRPRWRVLLKMRRHTLGAVIVLNAADGGESGVRLILESRVQEAEASGATGGEPAEIGWIVRVESADADFSLSLSRVGLTPLPPYILAARKRLELTINDDVDRAAYQTVFAAEPPEAAERPEHGSVAAPTAGLHFTPDLLSRIAESGTTFADVILHVGLGTFKPVETEFVEDHPMHTEWCMVPPESAEKIGAVVGSRRPRAGDGKGRIIALGTTAARTLESFDNPADMLQRRATSTRLLITPGYTFRHVDALLTNFHLPCSTLMAMVAAMLPGGATQLRSIYAEALSRGYRFYSYGDAMLVV